MTGMTLRTGAPEGAGIEAAPDAATAAWERIKRVRLDDKHLARHRIVTNERVDPAHVSFDLLRTRLLQALKERGWSRVAITSPTKGCGKTFVAANLAISLARRPNCRAILMDLDLRIPNIGRVLGLQPPARMTEFLSGARPAEATLRRIAANLAVGANAEPATDPAETIQEPATVATLDRMRATYAPDVVLYDLPPALACDDVLAFLPQVDGVLLVAAAGVTSAEDVRACERMFDGQAPLLGVILNKAEDPAIEPYYS
jgi:Mrp family chromosome partitioning ATPase